MRFLVNEVSTHSEVNKMTPSNIAIVFGPTLLRPKVETIETSLSSPLVNHAIERIIIVCCFFFCYLAMYRILIFFFQHFDLFFPK